MSKQKAPPVCCNQPAEFVVNGNSDSLQYYYCRICKQELPLEAAAVWRRAGESIVVKPPPPYVVTAPGGINFQLPSPTPQQIAVASSPCMLVRYVNAHDFTLGSATCRDCGDPYTSIWDGSSHSMLGDPAVPRGVSCVICGIVWEDHAKKGFQRCNGTQWAAYTPTGVHAPVSSQVSAKQTHTWATTSNACTRCGITGPEFAALGSTCDDFMLIGGIAAAPVPKSSSQASHSWGLGGNMDYCRRCGTSQFDYANHGTGCRP